MLIECVILVTTLEGSDSDNQPVILIKSIFEILATSCHS